MKPGYLTTEFWLTVVVGVLTNLGTIEVPDKYKWVTNGALVIGYALSRGLAKYDYGDAAPVEGGEGAAMADALEQENVGLKAELAKRPATAKKAPRRKATKS